MFDKDKKIKPATNKNGNTNETRNNINPTKGIVSSQIHYSSGETKGNGTINVLFQTQSPAMLVINSSVYVGKYSFNMFRIVPELLEQILCSNPTEITVVSQR